MNMSDAAKQRIWQSHFAAFMRKARKRRLNRPDGVWTQPNCFSVFPIAWPALERLAILAEQQVGIDCDFRCAQTQRENFFRQREEVLDRIACGPYAVFSSVFMLKPSRNRNSVKIIIVFTGFAAPGE